MSRETREFQVLRCDIPACGYEVIAKEGLIEQGSPLSIIEINGHNWDFCPICFERAERVLAFLDICVGVPFKFKIVFAARL